ncbi:MAG TPA: NAD(P)-dependent oxidoreductase [Pyrinomonadaceae bacterium]|jgi:nucleoside-diphosphate-sugar epimerase
MATETTDLVLGGDGLIGSELMRALTTQGRRPVSLDLKTGCDLRLVDDAPFAAAERVWFLAWDTGGAKYIEAADRQHEMYKHNCELSARVFDALARTQKPFLFITSQLAGQRNAYGLTKLLAEQWTLQLGGKLARLWNTYGWEEPDTRSHVITDLVLSGLTRGRVKTLTNGQERRRFIYKSDCVAALLRLFDGAETTADISGDAWYSIRQIAEEIASQLNIEIELGEATGNELIVDPVNILSGWHPVVTLTQGVSNVIADARQYLSHQDNLKT